MESESAVLAGSGLAVEVLDAGCCGMAGAFGFEAAHYDVSIGAGERVLLPAVRAAAADTLIVANGFSCREQIAQTTERRALHLAEVLRLGLGSADDVHTTAAAGAARGAGVGQAAAKTRSRARVAVAVGAGLLVGATLLWARRAGRS